MVAPKEILNEKYLETNLSAIDIVRKIKSLLDICLVDEENLIIKYEKKADIHPSEEMKSSKRIKNTANGEAFLIGLIMNKVWRFLLVAVMFLP